MGRKEHRLHENDHWRLLMPKTTFVSTKIHCENISQTIFKQKVLVFSTPFQGCKSKSASMFFAMFPQLWLAKKV